MAEEARDLDHQRLEQFHSALSALTRTIWRCTSLSDQVGIVALDYEGWQPNWDFLLGKQYKTASEDLVRSFPVRLRCCDDASLSLVKTDITLFIRTHASSFQNIFHIHIQSRFHDHQLAGWTTRTIIHAGSYINNRGYCHSRSYSVTLLFSYTLILICAFLLCYTYIHTYIHIYISWYILCYAIRRCALSIQAGVALRSPPRRRCVAI